MSQTRGDDGATTIFWFSSSRLMMDFFCTVSFCFSLLGRNSDPGARSRLFCPLPTSARASVLIATRRLQYFLPLSNCIELQWGQFDEINTHVVFFCCVCENLLCLPGPTPSPSNARGCSYRNSGLINYLILG